jgi:hypothetical protein
MTKPIQPLQLPSRHSPLTTRHSLMFTGHCSLITDHRSLITDHWSLVSLCLLVLALLAGCTHLGPRTVAVDRFDYSTAIADSWKQQTLLNIVKLRYMDLPVFVDVASIVAGYSMQTGGSLNGTLSSKSAIQGNFLAAGGSAIYTDRPTITYVPLTGEKFLRGLMTPIDPKNIFFRFHPGADRRIAQRGAQSFDRRRRDAGGGRRFCARP